MANGAKVALTGRLTKEPKKGNWQGTTIVSFTVAVNTTKKNKDEDKYIADFYNINVWGKSGDFILPRVAKGSLVQVYGDLTLQEYKDNNGQERQSLSVRATEVIPLTPIDKKKETSEDDGPPPF